MSDETFETALPTNGDVPRIVVDSVPDLKKARRWKPESISADRIDRLPPHAMEAEQGVIGCILLSPADCLPQIMAKFSYGDEIFYDLRHQTIYANAVQMFINNQQVDLITIQQRLKDFDMLEEVGGIPYLTQLQDSVPSTANVGYWADIVMEKFLLRKLVATCTEAIAKVYKFEGEVEALIDEVERDVLSVRKMRGESNEVGIRELVSQAIAEIEKKFQSQGAITGLATGFTDLDGYTDGLQPGEMIVVAAYPSVGKTALAMNIAENVVLNLKQPVGVFSLEMNSVSLVKRCICSTARVNVRAVGDGNMVDSDFPRITSAASRLSNASIYFDDTSDLSIYQLRAKARRMWQQYGVKLFIVDYLQLLNASGGNRKMENRQQEIADISNGIKSMAKELRVPVLALSQLTETQNGPRLRGSADIGQDADNVWMLEIPKQRAGEIEENEQVVAVDLWIRKQRNGPRNVCVKLIFQKQFTRFESLSRVQEPDIPQASKDYQPDL